ncbi:ribosome small subunit-dependent GTPase A [Aquibacillus koreensis]|uniref:Small ribosomal subunit biogenesis GTPase RsgA n=1 Tax=Aquibacillus koreensis TaxID=279446 RepID=A0A9X4AKD0_9BACI|nr:ribosome small subunit-dependent GTPase A [Aquibacillus koreensis]MCT2536381.1 ribosome small subunit-dependent GTPase A [Aquibacillus koreensis]MDC3421268.1 ribosome small subunit-dependent GTPase A [Aquibacillus koreensis]
MNLKELGWNDFFQANANTYLNEGFEVGRISKEHRGLYHVITENDEIIAEVTGKFIFQAVERTEYPAVGDWVIIHSRITEQKATIHNILPRLSKFSRKIAGNTTEEQVVAANINTVFIVNSLNKDLNLRRIERYLVMTWESGANPVIILSKADLCGNIDEKLAEVERIALGVPIHVVSTVEDQGLSELSSYLQEGQTIALLGSSGVGKSTLTNKLVGKDILEVQSVRTDDDKGRHTTTHRELVIVPSGGMLIDTPGMRELQLWEADQHLEQSFEDIAQIAATCRFRDCSHQNEPACAVQAAIDHGELAEERFSSYLKLQKEIRFLERKADKRAELKEKEKWKKLSGDRTRVHKKR